MLPAARPFPRASSRCSRRVPWRPVGLVVVVLVAGTGLAAWSALLQPVPPGVAVATAAEAFLASLAPEQLARARMPLDDQRRTDWHFIPKFARKGLPLREMTPAQETLALDLLAAAVSQPGFAKAAGIMALDEILRVHEGAKARNIRDPKRYFFTIFGDPSATGRWALSVEGHHLSLNFVLHGGRLVDSTPQFLGANPAEVRGDLAGLPAKGTRLLRDEEQLAFDLLAALDPSQRARAIIAAECPKDIRGAGDPQPPSDPPAGIPCRDLTAGQRAILRRLIDAYADTMVADVADERRALIAAAPGGEEAIYFAWAGATAPGAGHYYRVEGPSFVIEFVNIQPDAEGNPANHIHCVWRDRTGDFDLPVATR
ncbi:MAG: DUF3500 domain-containing protein [Planctomycetaceae bacterium]